MCRATLPPRSNPTRSSVGASTPERRARWRRARSGAFVWLFGMQSPCGTGAKRVFDTHSARRSAENQGKHLLHCVERLEREGRFHFIRRTTLRGVMLRVLHGRGTRGTARRFSAQRGSALCAVSIPRRNGSQRTGLRYVFFPSSRSMYCRMASTPR